MPGKDKMTHAAATTATIPTFDQLCRRYPRLRQLVAEAEDYQSDNNPRLCANAIWYDRPFYWGGQSLRDRVIEVADKAVKRFGQRAYDVCYDGIYSKLPDCRDCGCLRRED